MRSVAVPPASALDDTVARAAMIEAGGVRLALARRDAPGDGFERADVLYAPGPLLEKRIAASAAGGGTDLVHVGAQWWFERCAWTVGSAALACIASSGRLPSLRPGDVLIASADGIPTGLAFRAAPVAWDRSPGSPAAAGALREQLEAHLAPLVAALVRLRLRPAGALWRSAGDRLVQCALWVDAAATTDGSALRLARAVLGRAGALQVPVRIGSGADGAPLPLRRSCCLAHRTPAGTICENCPRAHGLDRAR